MAQIDEVYVARVAPGQSACFNLASLDYNANMDKVYPEISVGTFEVDQVFVGQQRT